MPAAYESDHYSLGEFIEDLVLIHRAAEQPADVCVWFDFGNLRPVEIDSWRGSYDQLAIGYGEGFTQTFGAERSDTPVDILISRLLLAADGETFHGYKGGHYPMHKGTQLWVANYGCSGSTYPYKLTADGNFVTIHTRNRGGW